MNTLAQPDRSRRPPKSGTQRRRPSPNRPLVGWAVVMVLALFSFYVHVLQEQVLRGEQEKQAQRQAASNPMVRNGSGPRADPGGEAYDLMQLAPAWPLRLGATR